ncbi:hypothetical protein VXQ18_04940 [Brucella abortus]|nr:hypothetical protein [Brucella abortus]
MAKDTPVRVRGALASTMYDKWVELGFKPGFGDDLFRIHAIRGMGGWFKSGAHRLYARSLSEFHHARPVELFL